MHACVCVYIYIYIYIYIIIIIIIINNTFNIVLCVILPLNYIKSCCQIWHLALFWPTYWVPEYFFPLLQSHRNISVNFFFVFCYWRKCECNNILSFTYYKSLPNYDNFHFWEPQKCKKGQLFLASIIIKINVSWEANQHIRMPSEGIWHWSNGCWYFSITVITVFSVKYMHVPTSVSQSNSWELNSRRRRKHVPSHFFGAGPVCVDVCVCERETAAAWSVPLGRPRVGSRCWQWQTLTSLHAWLHTEPSTSCPWVSTNAKLPSCPARWQTLSWHTQLAAPE